MKYNVTKDEGEPVSVTVFIPGKKPLVATTRHPNFDRIVTELANNKPRQRVVENLFDVTRTLEDNLRAIKDRLLGKKKSSKTIRATRVTDKISVSDTGTVLYNGEETHSELAALIANYFADGNEDIIPLALFMEKLYLNPSPNSREQLFIWMRARDFGITEDGDFVAYKYVASNHKSYASGSGIVNGKPVTGRLDNQIGNVVEMPREQVQDNPSVECSVGLHVGTWSYIEWYRRMKSTGGRVILCKINPKDVVSVPRDHNASKLRVCRYEVVEEVKAKDAFASYK